MLPLVVDLSLPRLPPSVRPAAAHLTGKGNGGREGRARQAVDERGRNRMDDLVPIQQIFILGLSDSDGGDDRRFHATQPLLRCSFRRKKKQDLRFSSPLEWRAAGVASSVDLGLLN